MKLLFILLVAMACYSSSMAQEKPAPDTLIVGDIVFEKVDIETGVTLAQWRRLLEIHLVPVIKKAAKKMKAGNYTINVRFLIEKDGSISDVKALNDPGYGLAEGAVKVIINWSSGPKWAPVEPNSNKVRSYHTQPITFQIQQK